jgi:large repetitive protein
VLLASGFAVPIAVLKPGEKVLATNVKTGKTSAEPVTAVLVHHDTNRYDLRVKTAHGTAIIHTTTTHLFRDTTTERWVEASALKNGHLLRTPSGGTATVVSGHQPRRDDGWMWDLTVQNDHDFYVSTGTIAVLAHNCPVLLGTKADIQGYMASKPEGEFDADFLNIRGTMAGGKGGVGGWTWTRNKAFIDDALNAGREVRLVTDPNPSLPAPPGGWPYAGGNTYARELNYLIGKGYGWQPVDDYWQVIRVGP